MDLQATIRELQDTLVVMGHIQAKQAQVQLLQAESIDEHEQRFRRIEANLDATGVHLEDAGVRLHEMTERLDAMIRVAKQD